ncbi:MAG: Crp/Fnr family transcriptional regulator [Burkholderiaceae bacterium]|nr:Crp/Fnr family transcriptional regulator [Burkholderiaceae bacterium]
MHTLIPVSTIQGPVMKPALASCAAPITAPRRPTGERIAQLLALIDTELTVVRRVVRAGEAVYRAGDAFDCLYVVHAGMYKTVNVSADGREQVVGLHFKGDWLGFDGIAEGCFGCDAIAMDTGEVWMIRYDALLEGCSRTPLLMAAVHTAMSRELARDRDSMMAMCTLPADARVADFLRNWAGTLEERGLRTDCITLRMTRAEIGNYLGMKLETVSRALSRLARDKVIGFSEKGRRDVEIPDIAALSAFVDRSLAAATLH